jgi:hypothetical protein
METLIFALIASHNYRQQESVVDEVEEFQPFTSAEKLRGKQTEPGVESTEGIAINPDFFDNGLKS